MSSIFGNIHIFGSLSCSRHLDSRREPFSFRNPNHFGELTCLNSSSPSGLKCQSTVARAETSSLLLQEMQPSRNPPPATASVRESTSAQPPRHWDTAGKKREGKKRRRKQRHRSWTIQWLKWKRGMGKRRQWCKRGEEVDYASVVTTFHLPFKLYSTW